MRKWAGHSIDGACSVLLSYLRWPPKERKDYKRAIEWAYRETLTRYPATEELADARAILQSGKTPENGMADLRWALFNSHEFRYLP